MDMECGNVNDFADSEIAACMRECNYEKYKTLVRMHLSFELDFNTDEFDLPCHEIVYEDRGKLKKWNRISKKPKHTTSGGCSSVQKGSSSPGNSPTEGLHQQIDSGFLFHLTELKDFLLLEKNLTQEGIFRKTGSVSRQNELRQKIQNEKPLDLEGAGYSAHDCSTVFKGYLADLPEPLLTDALYPAHLQIAPLCISTSLNTSASSSSMKPPNPERVKREQHLLNSVQLLLLLLPNENRQLLQHIIEMLHAVADHEHANKMSPENLATLFAPHLICPRNLPPEALHYVAKKMSNIIAYMVHKGMDIFEVPPKLSTDIRAYFMERKRKKTMSPEQTLDESISDMSTVNTVYTFVDREKTAAAHTTNNTDTELAQLYAHIQGMPESSKKRRLIKQFNKQNGQGTPLQLVVMNRLKNSEASRSAKSIGDSIKKHIFHKGIMSRTPKRSTVAMPTCPETPNFSNTKNPKLRVLFQSPGSGTSSTAAATISASSTYTACHTPYAIKTHPLQKSISSSSLLNSTSSLRNRPHGDEIESPSSNSSDGYSHEKAAKSTFSTSAPVSRQTSSELNANSSSSIGLSLGSSTSSSSNAASHHFQLLDPNCCITPLKIISEAAKHIVGTGVDKKVIAWAEDNRSEADKISNPCTPIQKSSRDLKSRYNRSEPNLSHMLKEKMDGNQTAVHEPISKSGKSLTRKLMKGVSMGNLKFPDSTKRLVRSVSSTLKHCTSDDSQAYLHGPGGSANADVAPLIEEDDVDLDDDTFEDDPDDHLDSDSSDADGQQTDSEDPASLLAGGGSSSSELPSYSRVSYQQLMLQQSALYRNQDLITSTPSLLLGRRSMSPITKSTQRMPKAMQESIMTPRSRKPVMVLTNTLGSSDPNQTIYQTDLSSFREQDEEDSLAGTSEQIQLQNLHNENATAVGGYSDIFRRQQMLQNHSFVQQNTISCSPVEDSYSSSNESNEKTSDTTTRNANALTNNFKEYLLSRSVLTASPVDSSFSSQPDDFGSTQEIENLDESQLSPSLLYCLDGNQPDLNSEDKSEESNDDIHPVNKGLTVATTSRTNRLDTNPFVILNNARKRAATNDLEKIKSSLSNVTSTNKVKTANKENSDNVEGYLLSKKLLISEHPGETSF